MVSWGNFGTYGGLDISFVIPSMFNQWTIPTMGMAKVGRVALSV
jgi:hypothetical protein